MSKVKHRKLQCEQDFRALRNYRKSIPGALLESINGVDHSSHMLERFQKGNNYMSKKCGHKRNLMTVERLLTRIAKYADELTKTPQGGSAGYQVHLSNGAGDAQWGQVHPGICRACAHGL